jgi:hypothetical protein
MKHINTHSQKGFVALFAVLLATVVLSISIGIANISYKEVVLSSAAREANSAFFAADSGAECMLLHDLKLGIFTGPGPFPPISCFGQDPDSTFSPIPYDNEGSTPSYAFGYQYDLDDSCARIELHKNVEEGDAFYTKIEAKGYNMSCLQMSTIQPGTAIASRLVERAVRASYVEQVITPGP